MEDQSITSDMQTTELMVEEQTKQYGTGTVLKRQKAVVYIMV